MQPRYLLAMSVLAIGLNPAAHAISNNQWANISDVGSYSLISAALVIPTVRQDWTGLRQSVYSMGTATGIAQLGKAVVHAPRPDNSDNNSFPSGHAAFAFSSATTLYRRYGWEFGTPAYALAALTATARVKARKHHWRDVVAGAAIGTTTGWYFTDPYNNKVQFIPWADSKGGGVLVGMTW